jgi:hypothetical protein
MFFCVYDTAFKRRGGDSNIKVVLVILVMGEHKNQLILVKHFVLVIDRFAGILHFRHYK